LRRYRRDLGLPAQWNVPLGVKDATLHSSSRTDPGGKLSYESWLYAPSLWEGSPSGTWLQRSKVPITGKCSAKSLIMAWCTGIMYITRPRALNFLDVEGVMLHGRLMSVGWDIPLRTAYTIYAMRSQIQVVHIQPGSIKNLIRLKPKWFVAAVSFFNRRFQRPTRTKAKRAGVSTPAGSPLPLSEWGEGSEHPSESEGYSNDEYESYHRRSGPDVRSRRNEFNFVEIEDRNAYYDLLIDQMRSGRSH